MSPLRICDLGAAAADAAVVARARALGFDHIAGDNASTLLTSGLPALVNIDLADLASDDPLVEAHPDWFAIRSLGDSACVVDPRRPLPLEGRAIARIYAAPDGFSAHWRARLAQLASQGVSGFRLRQLEHVPPSLLRSLIADLRSSLFIADIAGLAREALAALAGCGFDYCLSSLAWWDFRAAWLEEEYQAASRIAPVLARVGADRVPTGPRERRARYVVAAVAGSGIWMPAEFATDGEIDDCIAATNALVESDPVVGAGGALARRGNVLIRTTEADARLARDALLAVVNPGDTISPAPPALEDWDIPAMTALAPHEVRLLHVHRRDPLRTKLPKLAAKEPRVVIASVAPALDDGRFAVKRIVGDEVVVEADVFADGHPLIAAELVHGERRVPMQPLGNDRWRASFVLDRVGRHEFMIEAWIDRYGGFARDLARKQQARRDIGLDVREGGAMVRKVLDVPACEPAILLAPETVEAMRLRDERQFLTRSPVYVIDADRTGAVFASWYELFPRSQTDDAARHGTFRDVIARLPAIRAMGFDVLYMPPIHPIGRTNRKGRNNTLNAGPHDPGSVYAIGSADGGHDAVHPQLGTLDDFRALIAAARTEGLEIALDFAVQCSPDHPWLKEHPGWFDWRADGSIKYAENPPKLYEDIVNVDFYAKDSVPSLWNALRDVVRFWAKEGVRIFRVDNPHTKPFAFWRWLIASVRATDPDVIFLAEAFTRPKVMYHLAKIGFTQSYTYFTWRNTKEELTEYLHELNEAPVRDFFRPHFFVNTPDIDPYFLQTSGRPGFLIRAALAATLSGLWGVYSGFELCEAAALPGREEYLDSDKYEIKPRDWNAPGNIVADIGGLNRLRKAHPALQTHLGVTFYNAFNPSILYYGKHVAGETILVAVNLDPLAPQECDFEIPLWEWGLPDGGALFVEDLLGGRQFVWHGKIQHLRLEPNAPYRLWRVCPAEDQR
ncbi:MAG TPA: alpha-1,4-glucan--maltose-1-phosphate maltosyltransferase [Rhizomicrobium sp.]|jgi:starch synthase (maltosyl-transferring)|nr:alpha-1,4-glucan--maltose-1-phosphate maltosyltransferase [Rhizomicrobium sp.]